MGNYNCQECVDKEINRINELLLDNRFFRSDSYKENIPSQSSKVKDLRTSREDLKIALENTNLSQEQKNFVHKMLDENELLESEGIESLKLRIKKNNTSIENEISEEHKKLIEDQKEKIAEQQKIINEYKKQQLFLEQQQEQLKKEEQLLKNQIKEAKSKMQNNEVLENNINIINNNAQNIKIKTSEPFQIYNNNQQEQQDNNDEGENNKNDEVENENDDYMVSLRKNIRPIRREQEEEDYYYEQEEEHEQDQDQEQEHEEENQEENEMMNNAYYYENKNIIEGGLEQPYHNVKQSQKFKIETYEPTEDEPGIENNDNIKQNNNFFFENNDNNNDDNIYQKVQIKKKGPNDSVRRVSIKQTNKREEEDLNYKTSSTQREKGPKDSERIDYNKEIKFMGSFNDEAFNENNYTNKTDLFDSMKVKEPFPRDSKQKETPQNMNIKGSYQYDFKNTALELEKQNLYKQRKMFLEKNDIPDNMIYNNKNNIESNPISNAISQAVLFSNNNNINISENIFQNEDNANSHEQYLLDKKDIINPSEQEYIFNQDQLNKLSKNEINYSPKFNDINNTGDNSGLNKNTYQKIDNYGNDNLFNSNLDEKMEGVTNNFHPEVDINQQNSQREFDITISERDNPLIYSDDKGNMNFLEKKYAAYQNRMHQYDDNYNNY